MAERGLVIGVGNPMRGDDAVGPAVVESLEADDRVQVVVSDGDPAELMEAWEGAPFVVIVDAMRSGRPVGAVVSVDATHSPLPAGMSLGSSHHLGVGEAVELARVMGKLPSKVVVVGVEGASFGVGDSLSPQVAGAMPEARAAVERAIADA